MLRANLVLAMFVATLTGASAGICDDLCLDLGGTCTEESYGFSLSTSCLMHNGYSFDDNNYAAGSNQPINVCMLAYYGATMPSSLSTTFTTSSYGSLGGTRMTHYGAYCSVGECDGYCTNSNIMEAGDSWSTFDLGHGCENHYDYDDDLDTDTCWDEVYCYTDDYTPGSNTCDGSSSDSSNMAEIPSTGSSQGDPHLHFAHGGTADFRGTNGTFYAIHSAPGLQFAAKTVDVDFLLPRPQLVHGSFFTETAWVIRGESGRQFAIHSDAKVEGFKVVDLDDGSQVADRIGVWRDWSVDGIRALFKQSTLSVRANGWEMNVTRHPIYNYVSGSSHWRFDLALRPLDGTTGFESIYGKASETCYPHGIIGQSFDGDSLAVSGATDDYTFNPELPVITTKALAEGAIEGAASDYALKGATDKAFPFSRYDNTADAACAPRKLEKLSGKKIQSSAQVHAGSVDEPSLA